MEERVEQAEQTETITAEAARSPQPRDLEELSIFELDERLEFVAWCDNACNCTGISAS